MTASGFPPAGQIEDDLRGLFRGKLHFDRATRGLYASDGSPLRLLPHGIAVPEDAADVAEFLAYADRQGLPVTIRGSGTGCAGAALGRGVILDLGAKLTKLVEQGPDWVRVEPGMTWGRLQRILATVGLRLAPTLDRAEIRSVGGAVAVGALGGNAHRVGSVRDHVLGLNVVWNNGEIGTLGKGKQSVGERGPRHIELRAQTAAFLAQHRDQLQVSRPQTRFHRTPYLLHDVLTPEGLDLTRIAVGSEGTLAVVTEVTLRTVPLPKAVVHFALGFGSLEQAVTAGLKLRTVEALTACDALDQRLLAMLRAGGRNRAFPQALGAALTATMEGDDADELLKLSDRALADLRSTHTFAVLEEATLEDEWSRFEPNLRELAHRGLAALGTRAKPAFAFADAAVPVDELVRFVAFVRRTLTKYDLAAPMEIRVTTGLASAMPIVDLTNPEERERLWAAAEEVHEAAVGLGGTIGASTGTGLLRTPWLVKQAGPLLPIYRELKRIYDPKNLLNPGKLIDPDADLPAWPLPVEPQDAAGRSVPLAMTPLVMASADAAREQLDACNNCGTCRSTDRGLEAERMCPIFRALGTEAASPRAKVNLLRDLLVNPDDAKSLATEEARAIAGLCVHCKMCESECPSHVDVPTLMLEAKAQHYRVNGLERGEWLPARLEGLSLFGGVFALQVNFLLRHRLTRWLLEKLIGLSRRRTMPRFTNRTFLRRALRLGILGRRKPLRIGETGADDAGLPNKVAYFVDLFANFNDPTIGLAVVAVLERHGIEVSVPYRQRGSGLAPLVQGDVETAREIAAANVRTFAPLVREGYCIIVSEPSAAIAMTQEYPRLLNSPDADLVAANTTEITAFLWSLHQAGRLRTDFEPLSYHLGHHVPCHIKALGSAGAGPRLLELIPGLTVKRLDRGCSGMAGGYGLQAEHYETSHAAGEEMLNAFRSSDIVFGSTECSACRLQMTDAARKRTLHPVQYLALAYGLLPELRSRLGRPLGTRVTD